MSFAPLLGPGSPSHTFMQSSMSFLAALCSSMLAATIALIDSLAPRIPPSWCLMCKLTNRGHSHVHTEAERNAPPSDCGTGSYILKKLQDTDGASTTIAIVFNPRTKTYSLKKLEDIDGELTLPCGSSAIPPFPAFSYSPPPAVEKAIFRDSLPSSAASVKLHLPGETKLLSEVLLGDEMPRRTRRLRHQPSLVDGIFIIPGSRATTRTTTTRTSTYDPHEGRQPLLPVELPASPYGSVRRKYHLQHQLPQSPVELPADEISPLVPPAVLARQTPRLMVPRPRSQRSRKESPLLAPAPPPPLHLTPLLPSPPALLGVGSLERRASRASSMGSVSIQIAYAPSH